MHSQGVRLLQGKSWFKTKVWAFKNNVVLEITYAATISKSFVIHLQDVIEFILFIEDPNSMCIKPHLKFHVSISVLVAAQFFLKPLRLVFTKIQLALIKLTS